MMASKKYIARPGQSLEEHLVGVGNKARQFAEKIGLGEAGELLGLLHDFGKYSAQFQEYIQSIEKRNEPNFNPDIDENYVDPKQQKGKIDHSSAGAQWIWAKLKIHGKEYGSGWLCGQILALCIASHHSGLIDCLKPDGENGFIQRIEKEDDRTHLNECLANADQNLLTKINASADKAFLKAMLMQLNKILEIGGNLNKNLQAFYAGLLTRFLFSCLIDADRLDSAQRKSRQEPVNWQIPIQRLEKKLSEFALTKPIDTIRRKISDDCRAKAEAVQGIYTLTVPTGGGKTYASLRYALHHAHKHKLDHIIYIIPYTSIIEQNAEAIRKMIEDETDNIPWILEHHSNLDPDEQHYQAKLASENWESPIILTTMVQFLEVLFAGGTKSVRRMHQLANSVLIFDEVQTLPVKCVHLFCNVLNFLVNHAKTTAVLCTATQPLLNELRSPEKGQLLIPEGNELVQDVKQLFDDLERVEIINRCKTPGWSAEEITNLAVDEFTAKGNCLVIVNTKSWAQDLYRRCKAKVPAEALFHLSTNQYPVHRKKILDQIKARLAQELPVLCISTQLIEAGVDIDFASVIRFLAGLDSIAQAAGRCNRNDELCDEHGNFIKGTVHVVNPEEERIDLLEDIKIGKEKTRVVFDELTSGELLSPEKIKLYFKYYFFARADQMSYKVSAKQAGYDTTLMELLAGNNTNSGNVPLPLRQSFMTAGRAFEAIDAPTQSVIVYHDEGKHLVTELGRVAKEFDVKTYYDLLRKAQRYSVNVFPNVWDELIKKGAIHEVQKGEGVYFLDEHYYSEEFGLSVEEVGFMRVNYV